MSDLNRAELIGRLGRDPEVKSTTSGSSVANFSIATTERWKDKQGQRQEKTEWHNIVAWGYLATFAGEYLRKGRLVFVEGRLQTRSWENDGAKHYKTEVVASKIQILDRADGQQQEQPQQKQQDDDPYLEDDIPF